MKKWFLMVPFLLVAIRWVAIESFERYSKVPVCEEQKGHWGGISRNCPAYDQVLAADYRVRGGEVYWEDRKYLPEKICGFGISALYANIFSLKCWLEKNGYVRTVERRTLTKVENLSPKFKVLEGGESWLLDWQKKQYNKYAIGEHGVYFEGRLLEGIDPNDFSVIFPLGNHEMWSFFNLSRAGNVTFVSGQSLGNVDLALSHLLIPSKCPRGLAGCKTDGFAQLLQAESGVLFNGKTNFGRADFESLKILPPCEVSEKGESVACWSLQKVSDSASDYGVVAQMGKDVFYFHRHGVTKFIGATSTDFDVFERDGMLYMNSGGTNFRLLRGKGNFATLVLSRK